MFQTRNTVAQTFLSAMVLSASIIAGSSNHIHAADEDLLIVEQDYNIAEAAKDFNAKDIRQILYVTREYLCIDEFGDGGKTPTESYIIDMKNKHIVNLDHVNKQILLDEAFEDRRKRIVESRKQTEEDVAAMPEGKQRDRLIKLYRAMLDAGREFKTEVLPEKKTIAGEACQVIRVSDSKDEKYVPLEVAVHPTLDMPFDNWEVLFLLKIIGEKLSNALHEKVALFDRVPMEMHIDLAVGGKLDTKVISVKKLKRNEFDPKSRALGDPFAMPADYTPIAKKSGPATAVEKPKEKPRAD